MSLIKCKFCDKEISDKANVCPHCNMEIEDASKEATNLICKECGATLSGNLLVCSNCGFPLNEEKKKQNHKRIIYKFIGAATIGVIALAVSLLILYFSGVIGLSPLEKSALKDIKTLQSNLLSPDSIVLYDLYVHDNESEGYKETLVFYSALNGFGGMTSDIALVSNGRILRDSDAEDAIDRGDNDEIIRHGDVIFAVFAVSSGNEAWIPVDAEKLAQRIK